MLALNQTVLTGRVGNVHCSSVAYPPATTGLRNTSAARDRPGLVFLLILMASFPSTGRFAVGEQEDVPLHHPPAVRRLRRDHGRAAPCHPPSS